MARIKRGLSSNLISTLTELEDESGAIRLPAGIAPERILSLALELGGEDLTFYESSEMLVWDIGRKLGFYIPDYPLESNAEVRRFLAEYEVEDVPSWYERFGVPREMSREFWKYSAFCARNTQFWRRILLFPKGDAQNAAAMARDVYVAIEHCLAPTPTDTTKLFRI